MSSPPDLQLLRAWGRQGFCSTTDCMLVVEGHPPLLLDLLLAIPPKLAALRRDTHGFLGVFSFTLAISEGTEPTHYQIHYSPHSRVARYSK